VKDPRFLVRSSHIPGRMPIPAYIRAQVILYQRGRSYGLQGFSLRLVPVAWLLVACSDRQVTAPLNTANFTASAEQLAAQTDCEHVSGAFVFTRFQFTSQTTAVGEGTLQGISLGIQCRVLRYRTAWQRRNPDAGPSHDNEEHWDDQDIGRHPSSTRSGSNSRSTQFAVGGDRWNGQICRSDRPSPHARSTEPRNAGWVSPVQRTGLRRVSHAAATIGEH